MRPAVGQSDIEWMDVTWLGFYSAVDKMAPVRPELPQDGGPGGPIRSSLEASTETTKGLAT
jgi:hypothetical protein